MQIIGTVRTVALAAAVVAIVGAAGTARADYHPVCIGIVTGMDGIDLTVTGDSIAFGGFVECPGAEHIDVDVALTEAADGEAAASCGDVVDCLERVEASGTVSVADGQYRVTMTFHVESVGGLVVFDPVPRCGIWTVTEGAASGPEPCAGA